MHLTLIAPSDGGEVVPANEGFDRRRIRSLLKRVLERGHSYQLVDSGTLSEVELLYLYVDAAFATMRSHYRIRGVFGSHKASGLSGFGTKVPALLAYEAEDPIGVYPHATRDGPLDTIRSFLEGLARQSD